MLDAVSVPVRMLPSGGVDYLRPLPNWVNADTDMCLLIARPTAQTPSFDLQGALSDWQRPEEEKAWAHLQEKPTEPGDPKAFLKALKERPFPVHLRRSLEDIQRQIQEERDSWD